MRARGKQGAASEPETDSPPSDTSDTDKYAKRSDDSCSAGLSDGRALRWLLGAGVLTRFYGLAWPDEVVFDEVHFGKFITGYLTGQYFFDIHPPTGKLLIAAVAWASGFRGTQPFQKIGEAYRVGTNLFALRALPAAFGAALPPLLFSLARQLGCSSASSLLVGCLVLLDGATLVESRLLLTDSSLFFWEALQLLCALRASAAPANGAAFHAYLALTGVAIGAAVSTKWTALATMGVVGLDSLRQLLAAAHAALDSASRPPASPPLPPPEGLLEDLLAGEGEARRGRAEEEGMEAGDAVARMLERSDAAHGPSAAAPPPGGRAFPAAVDGGAAGGGGAGGTGGGDGDARRRTSAALAPVAMEAMARLVWLLLLPATIYLGSMALHLKLLPFAGRGDNFHPKPFRCRLGLAPRRDPDTGAVLGPATPQADCIAAGCAACRGQFPLSLPAAISSLNARMLSANAGIKKQHTFSSGWAHWPFGSQPVFYWSSTKCYADHYCRIYMAANPIVWGVGLTGLAALLLLLLGRLCSCGARRRLGTARGAPAAVRHGWLLLCGHALGWLPFAAVKRVAFLYHYIPSLHLSLLAAGLALDHLLLAHPAPRRAPAAALATPSQLDLAVALTIALAAASFLFFLPLYLGWPIEPADSRWRAKLLDPCRPVLEWVDSHVVPALFPNVSAVEQ